MRLLFMAAAISLLLQPAVAAAIQPSVSCDGGGPVSVVVVNGGESCHLPWPPYLTTGIILDATASADMSTYTGGVLFEFDLRTSATHSFSVCAPPGYAWICPPASAEARALFVFAFTVAGPVRDGFIQIGATTPGPGASVDISVGPYSGPSGGWLPFTLGQPAVAIVRASVRSASPVDIGPHDLIGSAGFTIRDANATDFDPPRIIEEEIPEPAGLAVGGLLAIVCLRLCWRRRPGWKASERGAPGPAA